MAFRMADQSCRVGVGLATVEDRADPRLDVGAHLGSAYGRSDVEVNTPRCAAPETIEHGRPTSSSRTDSRMSVAPPFQSDAPPIRATASLGRLAHRPVSRLLEHRRLRRSNARSCDPVGAARLAGLELEDTVEDH